MTAASTTVATVATAAPLAVNNTAAASTVEALVYALRRGGIALTESSNLRRLKEINEAQLHEVCARLQKFRPHIARAWTPAEVEALVGTWAELKNG
jgi:transposase